MSNVLSSMIAGFFGGFRMKTTYKLLIVVLTVGVIASIQQLLPRTLAQAPQGERLTRWPSQSQRFSVEILVNGRPLSEYYARGKTYVEALPDAEYEIRVTNSSPDRVAVALSVDG